MMKTRKLQMNKNKQKQFEQWIFENDAIIAINKKLRYEVTWFETDLIDLYDDYIDTTVLFDDMESMVDDISKRQYNKTHNKLYLEISGRQTGKTTRMVDDMVNHLDNGGMVFLYTSMSASYTKMIIQSVLEKYKYDSSKFVINPTENYLKTSDLSNECIRNYYDEFDFNKNLGGVDFNGYFCTTCSHLRSFEDFLDPSNYDLLLVLMKTTKLNYVAIRNEKMYKSIWLDEKTSKIESGEIFE